MRLAHFNLSSVRVLLAAPANNVVLTVGNNEFNY